MNTCEPTSKQAQSSQAGHAGPGTLSIDETDGGSPLPGAGHSADDRAGLTPRKAPNDD